QNLDSMSAAMATALNRQLKGARQHLDVLAASQALQSPVGYLNQKRKSIELLGNRLISAQSNGVGLKKQRFISLTAKLDAMSPLKVLTRGYAMAQADDGSVIRSVSQVTGGDQVTVSLSDGKFIASVTDVKENGI
ncbi:MAG: hypothetical protein IJX67_11420, partial [Oscillospiraceae bacterium]|nr:hypothetical protein [Oscillospiraceae bacterium]